jgi:hypothetical protein
MAIDVPVRATPARQLLTLEWMHAQMPDRYWEPADTDWLLETLDAGTSADLQAAFSIGTPLGVAEACLREVDREIDRRIREDSVLVTEPALMSAAAGN